MQGQFDGNPTWKVRWASLQFASASSVAFVAASTKQTCRCAWHRVFSFFLREEYHFLGDSPFSTFSSLALLEKFV
jgi:hypothetical protein